MPRNTPLSTFALLAIAACAHPPGPRPSLTDLRVGPPGPGGTSTLRARVRADFQEAGGMTAGEKVEHLLHSITFTAETPDGARSDRHLPLVMVGGVETVRLDADYPDRVAMDILLFPQGFGGDTLRLRAKSVFEIEGEEPSYVDVSVPQASATAPARVDRILIDPEGDRETIEVHLDRDIPAAFELWHCLDGRAHRMKRRSPRVYVREFDHPENTDHRVVVDASVGWLSAPLEPTKPDGAEDPLGLSAPLEPTKPDGAEDPLEEP